MGGIWYPPAWISLKIWLKLLKQSAEVYCIDIFNTMSTADQDTRMCGRSILYLYDPPIAVSSSADEVLHILNTQQWLSANDDG
jgi:hypothetical protein